MNRSEDHEDRATEFIQLLQLGKWSEAASWSVPPASDALTPESLSEAWLAVIRGAGRMISTGTPATRHVGPLTVVDVPLTYESVDLVGRVSLSSEYDVRGFFILTEATAAHISELQQ